MTCQFIYVVRIIFLTVCSSQAACFLTLINVFRQHTLTEYNKDIHYNFSSCARCVLPSSGVVMDIMHPLVAFLQLGITNNMLSVAKLLPAMVGLTCLFRELKVNSDSLMYIAQFGFHDYCIFFVESLNIIKF